MNSDTMTTQPTNDQTVGSWQLRLKHRLKADQISYRELAARMKTNDSIISNHLNAQTKQESLTFLKRVCAATGYKLSWLLFGEALDNHDAIPWLNRLGINQWLDKRHRNRSRINASYISGWFQLPEQIPVSSDGFLWQLESSEMETLGMGAGSWLLIDPAREVLKRNVGQSHFVSVGEPLVLVRLKASNGLMICKMQTIADQVWFLPPAGHTSALLLEDLDILGRVIAGLRSFDEPVLSVPHTI